MTARYSIRILSVVLPAILLSSCADAIKKSGFGQNTVGNRYTVMSTEEWSIWELGKTAPRISPLASLNRWPNRFWTNEINEQSEIWTKKGFVLQELGFINGIKSGEEIIRFAPKGRDYRYKVEMNDVEVSQLIANIIFLPNTGSYELSDIALTSIGGIEARHFSAQHIAKSGLQYGLEYKISVYAFRRGERLDFIYFSAPSLAYFDAYWPQAEKIVHSIKFQSSL